MATEETLRVYLGDTLVQLNPDQMQQIMEMINAQSAHPLPSQTIKNKIDPKNEDGIQSLQSEYVFDVTHTFVHSIFGDATASKIRQIVDHKLILILLAIAACFVFPLQYTFGLYSIAFSVFLIAFWCSGISWLIFKLLLLNKVAFKLCIQSFDFWIKVGHGLLCAIAWLLLRGTFDDGFALMNIRLCFVSVGVVLMISWVSLLDAVHSTKAKKLIVLVSAALAGSFLTITSQFMTADETDFKITIQLTNGVNIISMQSFYASSIRIITIFLWKQSYKTTWKSKGTAVAISNAPKIRWIDSSSTKEMLSDAANASTNTTNNQIATQKVPEIDLQSDVRDEGNP
eukprot:213078_1